MGLRECGCPEFIEKCVHFGDRVAVLSGLTRHNEACPKCIVAPVYQVCICTFGPCALCGIDIPLLDSIADLFYQGSDEGIAGESFEEATSYLRQEVFI